MKRIAIASHIALIKGQEYDGIGNVLIETLGGLGTDFYMVRHSMDGLLPSLVRHYKGDSIRQSWRLPVIQRVASLRYLTEIIATIWHFSFRKKVDVYVGIDPLNALAGVLLRKLGKVDKSVFYTPDYSPQRFENNFLNRIYHAIDRYCVRHADEVWSVSSRIQAIRREMGLEEVKNIFIPNVPPADYAELRENKRSPHKLIMYGIVDRQLDYEGAVRTVAQLQNEISDIKLVIVGNGPAEEFLKQLAVELGVSNRVMFAGKLPLGETLRLASQAGIGLALYTGEWGFNYYGDSTKCREYFFFGLPVISTDTHSTVEEIETSGAGIIVEKSTDAYCRAVKDILEEYEQYSQASRQLGAKYEGVHAEQLKRILN